MIALSDDGIKLEYNSNGNDEAVDVLASSKCLPEGNYGTA